jgi:hypothetical protein
MYELRKKLNEYMYLFNHNSPSYNEIVNVLNSIPLRLDWNKFRAEDLKKDLADGGMMADGGMVSTKGFKKGDMVKHESTYKIYEVIDVENLVQSGFLNTSSNILKLKDKETGDVISANEARFDKVDGGYMADGGSVAKGNYEMLMSQAKEVMHHAEELMQVVKPNMDIEAWVVSKAERATTDLSDITHYLDGKKMAMGGMVKANSHKVNA